MNNNLRLRLHITLGATLALSVFEAAAQLPVAPGALRTDSKETQSERPLAPMSVLALHIRNDIETDFSAANRLRYLLNSGRFASCARYYDALQAYFESEDRGVEFFGMLQFVPTLANTPTSANSAGGPGLTLDEYYLAIRPNGESRLSKLLEGREVAVREMLVACGRIERIIELNNNMVDEEMTELGFGRDWRTEVQDVEKWPEGLMPAQLMAIAWDPFVLARLLGDAGYQRESLQLISPFLAVFEIYEEERPTYQAEFLLTYAELAGDRNKYEQGLQLLREAITEIESLPLPTPSKTDYQVLKELRATRDTLSTQQRNILRASPQAYNASINEYRRKMAAAGSNGHRVSVKSSNRYHLMFRNWNGVAASRESLLNYNLPIGGSGRSGWAFQRLFPFITFGMSTIAHAKIHPLDIEERYPSLPLADPRLTELGLEVTVKSRIEIVDAIRQLGSRSLAPDIVRLIGVAAGYRHLAFPPIDADVHQVSVDWIARSTSSAARFSSDDKESSTRMERYRVTGEHPAGFGPGLPSVRLATLQGKLDPDQAFFEIVRVRPFDTRPEAIGIRFTSARYLGWLVKSSGEPSFYDLGLADELEQKVGACRDEFQQSLQTIEEIGEVAATKRVNETLDDLALRILHPLADDLHSVEHLTICPDGELWLVPWAALPFPSGKALAEEVTVSHRFSIGELLTKRPPIEGTASGAVVFSNPHFDATPQRIAEAEQSLPGGRWKSDEEIIRPKLHVSMTALTPFDRKDLPFSPAPGAACLLPRVGALPGTVEEAKRVAPSLEMMTGVKPTVLAGDEANEAALQQVSRPEYLILQTHGFFLPKPEEPTQAESAAAKAAEWGGLHFGHWPQGYRSLGLERPFARCGLLLAGANEANAWGFARSADGIVSALEVAMMDLRGTKMVVLSACDTGIGDVRVGEGVTSLCQAFQMAGAESVVSSLWQVEDESTADIMADFFEELSEGQLRHVALRNAQLRQIKKQREKHGVAHPYFWAAFTLTGETGVDRPMKK